MLEERSYRRNLGKGFLCIHHVDKDSVNMGFLSSPCLPYPPSATPQSYLVQPSLSPLASPGPTASFSGHNSKL